MISTRRPLRSRYDAVVVGARCAGAATAMLLARRGLSVLAIDRGSYGSDTRSTHALMRGGVLQLQRWGLLGALASAGTPPIREVTFHYGEERVGFPLRERDGVDALYAPRRTLLDALLVDAARSAGADVRHGTGLRELRRSAGGRVTGAVLEDPSGTRHEVAAGIVIGADGVDSSVARRVGARPYRVGSHASSVLYAYWPGLRLDGYHWYYVPGVSAGAIPTNDGSTCIFTSVSDAEFRRQIADGAISVFGEALATAAPELCRRIERIPSLAPLRAFAGRRGFFRPAWGQGWALVGDAGYFRDPITAHGITDALRDAELLARAVATGTTQALADYQAKRDALSDVVFQISDAIASFDWDLEQVKGHHTLLSKAMGQECAALAELHGAAFLAA